jgi:hypothetical protein
MKVRICLLGTIRSRAFSVVDLRLLCCDVFECSDIGDLGTWVSMPKENDKVTFTLSFITRWQLICKHCRRETQKENI